VAQAAGYGSAIASVSTPVATRPVRTSEANLTDGSPSNRDHTQGCTVQISAPIR
jgi:hypothetical protein